MYRKLCGVLVLAAGLAWSCAERQDFDEEGYSRDSSAEELAAASGSFVESVQKRIDWGDYTFDVRVAGPEDGEVVVLLHGFPQTSFEWRHQIQALAAAGFRVLAPDQRGYSPDARPTNIDDYTIPRLVEDVVGLTEAIGVDRFHLVGHDWGAIVAWAAATSVAERLITVTSVSVPHLDAFAKVLNDPESCQVEASSYFDVFVQTDSEDAFLAENSAQLRALYSSIDAQAVEEYLGVLGSKEALGAALNWYRANMIDRNLLGPPIGSVKIPTLFVWGDQDAALCKDGAFLTEEYIDGPYRFEVFRGVGHWVPELASNELDAVLIDHLEMYSER